MRHVSAGRAAVAAGNVLACSGLLGFIACSDDQFTSPSVPKPAATLAPSASVAAADWWAPPPSVTIGDTTVSTFTIDPTQGGSPSFGRANASRMVIPALAICDPRTSGYGPASWDAPCPAAQTSITFVVRTWIGQDGTPKAVFLPDVRFSPSKRVMLHLSAMGTPARTAPAMQWCTSQMTNCVDEAASDPTAAATFDPSTYSVWRRVKHLSGYNVTWGSM